MLLLHLTIVSEVTAKAIPARELDSTFSGPGGFVPRVCALSSILFSASTMLACAQTAPTAPLPAGTRAGWYVTANGTSGGAGTSASPWDLQTALAGGNGQVQPGDTIWLRAGTYPGTFYTTVSGSAAAPVVVRAYPGERAIIDGGTGGSNRIETFSVSSHDAIFWGFEIMQSSTLRMGEAGTGTPLRPGGVYVQRPAHDVKFINLIVHDVGHAFYTENAAHNVEIYGCVIYNGGIENQRTGGRSDGHGIYIKGDGIGWKVARDNVIFNQFGFGIHAYAEAGQALKNIVLDGNTTFNNGTPSDYQVPNFHLGGTVIADNDSVTNNSMYFPPGVGDQNARIGYSGTMNGAALVKDNIIVGGAETLELGYWSNLTVQGNLVQGPTRVVFQRDPNSPATQAWSGNTHYRDPNAQAWRLSGTDYTFTGWKAASGATDAASFILPSAPQIIVRPNRYEPGRALITVYNWSSAGSVAVPVAGVLNPGDPYVVRSVQNLFGKAVVSGTYQGTGTISIPMTAIPPVRPIGGSFQPLQTTGPLFDVFLLTGS